MIDHLDSFDLGFLTPELLQKIVKKAVVRGTTLKTPRGGHINYALGDMLLIINTRRDDATGLDHIVGYDVHAKGCAVWNCVVAAAEGSMLRIEARQGAPLPLAAVNGGALPSLRPGSTFRGQVIAYPETLSLTDAATDGAIVAGDGETVTVSGEILGVRRGETRYLDGVLSRFLAALVAAGDDEIELVFADRLVNEGEEELLRPGAYLRAVGRLAANVALGPEGGPTP